MSPRRDCSPTTVFWVLRLMPTALNFCLDVLNCAWVRRVVLFQSCLKGRVTSSLGSVLQWILLGAVHTSGHTCAVVLVHLYRQHGGIRTVLPLLFCLLRMARFCISDNTQLWLLKILSRQVGGSLLPFETKGRLKREVESCLLPEGTKRTPAACSGWVMLHLKKRLWQAFFCPVSVSDVAFGRNTSRKPDLCSWSVYPNEKIPHVNMLLFKDCN